jgi:hypothetical protein
LPYRNDMLRLGVLQRGRDLLREHMCPRHSPRRESDETIHIQGDSIAYDVVDEDTYVD